MANITFIIGNGLDLKLGFKTSYRDFYKYVEKNALHPRNKIYKAIKSDPETWADFEKQLGLHTQYLEKLPEESRRKEAVAFHEDLADITDDLAEYLSTQEKCIDDDPPKISFDKRDFFEGLASGQKDILSPYISSSGTRFDFVTLNYTQTLEKILPNRNILLVPQNIVMGNIHHIHGDLVENMTLGVSDETQLSSVLEGGEKDYLIKPRSIELSNDGRIQVLKQIIDNSSIVVLFGTSIGETDNYIWNYIIRWLQESSQRYVVIHKHDDSYTNTARRSPWRNSLFVGGVQNVLLDHAPADLLNEDQKVALRSRIFVIYNTKHLFAEKNN